MALSYFVKRPNSVISFLTYECFPYFSLRLSMFQDRFRTILLQKEYGDDFCLYFTKNPCTDDMKIDNEQFKDEEDFEKFINIVQIYGKQNLALLKVQNCMAMPTLNPMFQVFFKDPYHTQIVRERTMTAYQFIGSAGGLLGLCMGFSLVSIVEIIFHCADLIVQIILPKFSPKSL